MKKLHVKEMSNKCISTSQCNSCVLISQGHYDKIPHTVWLKQQKFISHNSGDCKFEIKVSAG